MSPYLITVNFTPGWVFVFLYLVSSWIVLIVSEDGTLVNRQTSENTPVSYEHSLSSLITAQTEPYTPPLFTKAIPARVVFACSNQLEVGIRVVSTIIFFAYIFLK